MKLSTLLLSSAAVLVAGSAFAADLPAKKGAPAAKAATGCPAFGAGFWQIPGADTCLKISGYVESDSRYSSGGGNSRPSNAPYTMTASYGLEFNARNNSDMGVVSSRLLIEDNSTTYAYGQIGGFKAGKAEGILNWGGGYNYAGNAYSGKLAQLQYSAALGGSTSLAVAATTASNGTDSGAAQVASRPDLLVALTTTAGAATVKVGAASHESAGSTSGVVQGWAAMGSISVDAGAAKVMGYAAYANSASAFIGAAYTAAGTSVPYTAARGVYEGSATNTTPSSGSILQAQVDVPVGSNSFGVFVEQRNASGGGRTLASTTVEAAYTHTIAKGLFVRPSIAQDTVDGVGANVAYLRIERDF